MRQIERIIGKKLIAGEMPTAAGICQKQLIKVIDDLEQVKVNEKRSPTSCRRFTANWNG